MPRRKAVPALVKCHNCGVEFETTRSALFCAERCRTRFRKRMEAEGAIIMPYLKAWLAGRGGGNTTPHPIAGECMREVTSIVRDMLAADKAEGRPPATDYAEAMFATGIRYMDRKRR